MCGFFRVRRIFVDFELISASWLCLVSYKHTEHCTCIIPLYYSPTTFFFLFIVAVFHFFLFRFATCVCVFFFLSLAMSLMCTRYTTTGMNWRCTIDDDDDDVMCVCQCHNVNTKRSLFSLSLVDVVIVVATKHNTKTRSSQQKPRRTRPYYGCTQKSFKRQTLNYGLNDCYRRARELSNSARSAYSAADKKQQQLCTDWILGCFCFCHFCRCT